MMKIALSVALVVVLMVAAGCKSSSGSRQFIPGKGWKLND